MFGQIYICQFLARQRHHLERQTGVAAAIFITLTVVKVAQVNVPANLLAFTSQLLTAIFYPIIFLVLQVRGGGRGGREGGEGRGKGGERWK